MDRLIFGGGDEAVGEVQHRYHKMMSQWASNLLANDHRCRWAPSDPLDDYRNRDWRLLYQGDVLDD